jgi:hypothetical protein
MMLLSLATCVLWLVAVGNSLGNHGLWAALHIFLVVRGVSADARDVRVARRVYRPRSNL